MFFFIPFTIFRSSSFIWERDEKSRVEKQIYDRKKNSLKKKQPEMIIFVNQEMYGTVDGRTDTKSSTDA